MNRQDWEIRAAVTIFSGLIFATDLVLPLGIAGGVLYVAPVVYSLRGIRKRTAVYAAALATALILLGYAFSPPGGTPWMVAANRVLSLGAVWVAVSLGLSRRQSEEKIRHLNRALKKQVLETRSERDDTEDIFRSVLESAPDGILGVDKRGNIVLANSESGRLFGYAREELLGQPVEMLVPHRFKDVHPKHRERFSQSPSLRQMGEELGLHGLRKDGSEFPVEIALSPLHTSRGLLVTAIVRDVTERRRAEAELRESEKLFRELTENIRDVVYLRDSETRELLYVNPAFETIYGRPLEAVSGGSESYLEFVHPDDRESVLADFEILRDDRYQEVSPHRIVRPDGAIRWIEGRTFALRDEQGIVRRYIGTAQDVTERITAEAALRESEERFRQLADNLQDVVYLRSVDNTEVLYVNAAVEQVFGRTREEFAEGKEAFRRSVHPDDHPLLEEAWARQAAGDFEVDTEYRLILPDQTIRWIRGRTFPIRDESGTVIRVGSIHTDITEQKNIAIELRRFNEILEQRVAESTAEVRQSEAKLAEVQKRESIGQLAGGVAHDFNNLMTVINGYTELLLNESGGNPDLTAKLDQIKTAADRAATLTQKLLAYSRQLMLRPEAINLNSVIEDAHDRLCPIPMEGYAVTTHLDPHLDPAMLDPQQITEVLLGLTLNACEAMPEGGTLTVETANATLDEAFSRAHPEVTPGRYVKLSIIDTGIGMDNHILKSIFEPFFTTKDKSTGAGMGLASIYGMVKQSSGFIEVRSRKGEGTRFDVYFPSLGNGGEHTAAA